MPCRKHEHKCPGCLVVWWCADYGCIKTQMRRQRFCHGSRCVLDVKQKEEKPVKPQEPELFGGPYIHFGGMPPHVGTDTSVQAALEVAPRVSKQQQRVFEAFRINGPQTDDQISQATGLPLSSICARRNELLKLGLVAKTIGRRRTRNGGTAVVWRIR